MATTLNSSGVVFPNGQTQIMTGPSCDATSPITNLGTASGNWQGFSWADGNGTRSTNTYYTNSTGRVLL